MDPLQDFFRYLKSEKRFSPHTLLAYEIDLTQFCDFCKTSQVIFPNEVDAQIIRSWVVTLIDESISARSVNRKLSSLKGFFRFMVKHKQCAYDPTLSIISPKTRKRLSGFVPESQMSDLFESHLFSDDFTGTRDRVILTFFYMTGVRLSELVNIRDVDIDMSAMQVKITGKRNKQRIIPLTPSFIKDIIDYKSARKNVFETIEEQPFFVSDKGKKLNTKWVYRMVNNYLSKVTSIEKKSPHMIRHTFATHMLNNGADLIVIKELLGHTSLAATQVYTHNSFEKLKRVYKQAHPRA
jgi:integrase/recombinase XerC